MRRLAPFTRPKYVLCAAIILASTSCQVSAVNQSSNLEPYLTEQQVNFFADNGLDQNAQSTLLTNQSFSGNTENGSSAQIEASYSSGINLWGLACSVACLIIISRQQARSH